MEEQINRKYTREHLQNLPYRVLQKLAKSLNLPSNVKKMHLIDLVNAKKFKSQVELNAIIDHVKLERRLLSQSKAKIQRTIARRPHVQGSEISSTKNSPPITTTPKRISNMVVKYSPELQRNVTKYPPKQSLLQNSLISHPVANKTSISDRVLRSFQNKPNYRILNMSNPVFGVIKAQNPDTRINIVSRDGKYPKFNVTAVVKKHVASQAGAYSERQMVVSRKEFTLPSKRHRTISGIYPLTTPDKHRTNSTVFTPTVNFTRRDGSLSKIKALVHKPRPKINFNIETTQREITIQDLINDGIDNQDQTNSICTLTNSYLHNNVQTSNISDLIQENCNDNNSYQIDTPVDISQYTTEGNSTDSQYAVFSHKKIRAEPVNTQTVTSEIPKYVASVQALPKFSDVFNKYDDAYRRNLSQPIYVQVNEGAEKTENYPVYEPTSTATSASLLETVYNFKNQFITNPPLLQVVTTAITTCVYSTPVITTAVPHAPAVYIPTEHNTALYQGDNHYYNPNLQMIAPIQDCQPHFESDDCYTGDVMCNEEFRSSTSSLETVSYQEVGGTIVVPQMVEDALEMISQDGDYMERIGMDLRVQCILCSWAGPKFILEYHIRKEHASQIVSVEGGSWRARYTLGALAARGAWACGVARRGRALLALAARYRDPNCLMAALHTFSSDDDPPTYGKITIYNRVTGEPYSWEGQLQQLPHTMPHHNDTNCFNIELSKLDLLPNSANLKLHNREFLIETPAKVIVGQPELDDIHIILFIKVS